MQRLVGIRVPLERLLAIGNASGIVGIEAGLADWLAHALHNDARHMMGIVAEDSPAVDASAPHESVGHGVSLLSIHPFVWLALAFLHQQHRKFVPLSLTGEDSLQGYAHDCSGLALIQATLFQIVKQLLGFVSQVSHVAAPFSCALGT